MKISMIVAYGKNWEIGLKNKMLWHISEDFKNFKTITSEHHILMGRKTFESIEKPLPNRTSIVLSNTGFKYEGVHTFSDVQEAFNFAKQNNENELFIIGGASIYETFFPYIDKLYLSEVNFEGKADTFLTPIDFSNWELVEETKYEKTKNSLEWIFRIYNKKSI